MKTLNDDPTLNEHLRRVPGCFELSAQIYMQPDEPVTSIVAIPVDAVEHKKTCTIAGNVLEKHLFGGAIVGLYGNGDDEASTAETTQAAQDILVCRGIPSIVCSETYSANDENRTIGNVRRRGVAGVVAGLLQYNIPIAEDATLIIGDIDLLGLSPDCLISLHTHVTSLHHSTGATPLLSQASHHNGRARHLKELGILRPDAHIPELDRRTFWGDLGRNLNPYTRLDAWNAVTLKNYMEADGFNPNVTFCEVIDLHDRIRNCKGEDRAPSCIRAWARLNPRRSYLEATDKHMAFATTGDQCRGKSLYDIQDIPADLADRDIQDMWDMRGNYSEGCTYADAAVYGLAMTSLGRGYDLSVRLPQSDWRPDADEVKALEEARRKVEDVRRLTAQFITPFNKGS